MKNNISEKELIEKNGYGKYFDQAEVVQKVLRDNNIKFKWGTFFVYSKEAYERGLTSVDPEKYNLKSDILYGYYGDKCPYLLVNVPADDVNKVKEMLRELDVEVLNLDFYKDGDDNVIKNTGVNVDDFMADSFEENVRKLSLEFSRFDVDDEGEILFANRDDLHDYLVDEGVDEELAYKVMENVRKGEGLDEDQIASLKKQGVDEKFFEFCKKVRFLVAKGKVIEHLVN